MKDITINIALMQFDVNSHSLEESYQKAKEFIPKAKQQGADIALFPELWTTGYEEYPSGENNISEWKEKSIWIEHPDYEKYINIAKQNEIAILLTFLESDEKRKNFYNTATLIDARGETVLHYRKTHTVDKGWERMFVRGEELPVTVLSIPGKGDVKIGAMICYDREFPEPARILMLQGAEIILTPNACELDDGNRIPQFQTRAFENMLGIAMANYPRLTGRSIAFDGMREKGKEYNPCLVKSTDNTEGIFMANFDIEKLRAYRANDIHGDAYRRPDLYDKLLENNPQEPFIREKARR
jgi:predicted amidohydrolase